jgi:hypothetical protein
MRRPGRITEVDTLRGLLLVLMTIDHLPGFLGSTLTEVWGFVSTAEGFVFTSALLVGLIYSGRESRQISKHCLVRAGIIYACQVGTVVGLFLLLRCFPGFAPYWSEFGMFPNFQISRTGLSSALFFYQPRYLDILPLFCAFLVCAPGMIRLLRQGRYRALGFGSILLWCIGQHLSLSDFFFGPATRLGLYYVNQSPFNLLAWQLVLVSGVMIGYFYRTEKLRLPPAKRLSVTFHVLAVSLFVLCFGLRHGLIPWFLPPNQAVFLTDKTNLGVLRLSQLFSTVYLLWSGSRFLPKTRTLEWFAFLGKHSLPVYVFHLFLLYLLAPFRYPWHFLWPYPLQAAATSAAVISLSLAAYGHALWQTTFPKLTAAALIKALWPEPGLAELRSGN